MAGLASPFVVHWRWLPAFALAGAVPLGAGLLGLGAFSQTLMAATVFALALSTAGAARPLAGVVGIGLAFFVHSVLAIWLAASQPDAAASLMPDGPAYWQAQYRWIMTGRDPEYEVSNWLPQHAHLLIGITILGVLSLGLLPLVQGVYEVDLMNYYVGRLLAASEAPWTALLFGWHPWSVCRGVCFALLVYELANATLAWVTRRPLSSLRARLWRWAGVVTFWLADAALKFWMIGPVREGLRNALAS